MINRFVSSLAIIATLSISACAPMAKSEEEAAARRAASMRHSTTQCTIYLGGVSGIKDMLAAAKKEEAAARKLGATDAMITKAQQDVEMTWATGVALIGEQEMCKNMVASMVARM